MAKSQEDEDIEKIFQKSRMTTEAPIVKQEVDQEKPKELENTMYRSAKYALQQKLPVISPVNC